MYVYILLASIIILSQNSIFIDAYSQDLDLKCNNVIDKNGDGIPDIIEAKSSINWSHCNLEGQDISKIDSFDYTESKRPFDKNGVPYDNHEFEFGLQNKEMYDLNRHTNAQNESIFEKIYKHILKIFNEEYIKSDNNNNFHTGANLRAANLEGANLKNSKIIDTNFSYANLADANLSNADLTGSSFYKANMNNVDLTNANLSHVQLYEADLTNAILVGVNLSHSNLCDFSHFFLTRTAHLESIGVFSGVDLTNAVFNRAELRSVDFSNVTLENTQFLFADLTGAEFPGKDLTNINFGHANLSYTNLSNTILSHKNLYNTILVGANLSNANLSGVDLSGRDLSNTNLSGCKF